MIYELNHLGILVADVEKSVDFYTGFLGATKVWGATVAEKGMEIVYLQLAQGLVELISVAGSEQPYGANHFGFYSDDLDADFASLVAAGATAVFAPRVSGSGVGRQAMVQDPDGVAIELLQRDLPLRSGVIPHPHIIAIDHFAIQSSEHDRTLEFYRDRLDMAVARRIPIPSMDTTLTYLHHGEDVVEVLPRVHDGNRLHHIALAVVDVEAALADLVARGGTPDGPARPAAGGVGSIGSVTDPDGVVIEFVDRPRVLQAVDDAIPDSRK
jgi:catechol 2,3-dioxygenase-like lactoylglutathione lyase family enzyme